MHAAALEFVSRYGTNDAVTVIDIGSRDINGTCRPLFPAAQYIGLDLYAGPAVDWVGNAAEYVPDARVEFVLCTEVLEHAPNWRELVTVGASWLKPGGKIIVTCAGPGRAPHSHHDGGAMHPGEYYDNRTCDQIADVLRSVGMTRIYTEQVWTVPDDAEIGTDTRVMAIRS